MYKFWYDVLRAKYGDKIRLLMTDTDSFIFQIFCEDLDKELLKMTYSFDFSNYDQNHPLYSSISKKIPGYMKNKFPTKIITHFVGIRSKEYAFKFLDGKEEKEQKGSLR